MSGPVGDRLKELCLGVLGTGRMRPAPATWASALSALLFVPIWWLAAAAGSRWIVECLVVLGVLAGSVLSIRWGRWAIARYGSTDPREFVLDEFAGQWLALLLLPVSLACGGKLLAWVVLGQFLLFRVLDIVKPFPARRLQRLPAGWGILVDDLFAGAYANVAGQLLWRLTPLAAYVGA